MKNYRHIVNNKKYKSLVEVAKEYNIKYNTLAKGVSRGETAEQVVNKIIKKRNGLTLRGKTFKNVDDMCEYFRVSESSVKSRISRKEETPAEAVEYMLSSVKIVNNKKYKTISDVARDYGLDEVALCDRVRRHNETIEEAIKVLLKYKEGYKVYGKRYKYLNRISKDLNVNYDRLRELVNKRNMSAEEAVTILLNSKRRQSKI